MHCIVVNPDLRSAKLVGFVLEEAGHTVVLSTTADEALHEVSGRGANLVVLEIDLPGQDGFALCKELRRQHFEGAIIFVTKRHKSDEKIRAFNYGADDFIVDPFDPLELVARADSISRRYQRMDHQVLGTILKAGDAELSINTLTFRITGQEPVVLTPTELRLLECLMRNSEITVSQDMLVERGWGNEFSKESNLLAVYIQRLRRKIEREPNAPERIQTVRGIGYVFRAAQRVTAMPESRERALVSQA
jgi:DNA-binding response OmpR family regulator